MNEFSTLSEPLEAHVRPLSEGSPALVELLEGAELAAWTDLYGCASERVRARLGLEVEQRRSMTALRAPGVGNLLFNRIFVHPSASDAELGRDLEALVRRFDQRGVRRWLLHVPPTVRERSAPILAASGLQPFARNWVKFVRDVSALASHPTDLTVRRAGAADAAELAQILSLGFDIREGGLDVFAGVVASPAWRAFIACDGEAPVAAALAYVGGRAAVLAGAATLPHYRRRGAQGALLASRITAASEAGCSHVSAETGELQDGGVNVSYRNLLRAGLEPTYVRQNFAPPGTTWAAP